MKKKNYIIAEIGLNHNGSIELCKRMFREAKSAGCSAVKLQSLDWNSTSIEKNLDVKIQLSINKKTHLASYLKEIALTKNHHKILKNYARKIGIEIISTTFSNKYVDLLKDLKFDKIKIASQDINNYDLIRKAAKSNLPIIISTGMADLKEIISAVEIIEKNNNKKIIILHCVSNYPTKAIDLNLNRIQTLKKIFPHHIIGFSDHTLDSDAAIVAKSLGAEVFEKHFTFNKQAEGFDHAMSLDKAEMEIYCKKIAKASVSLGAADYRKIVDKDMRKNMRRSIVTKLNIKKGTKISLKNIDFKRPHGGISPSQVDNIIGKVVNKNLKRDIVLKISDLN
jgi:sialic acid synthase SpsE